MAIVLTTDYTSSPLGIIDGNFGYDPKDGEYSSLFSSTTKFRTTKGSSTDLPPVLGDTDNMHNDSVYNMSTAHIIEKLQELPPLKLKFADFAYLKDYGVYPNNRLVIIRRFQSAIMDDLYSHRLKGAKFAFGGKDPNPIEPMSTIIGYKGETDNFMDFEVQEEWIDADATFKEILNEVGGDFGMSTIKLGDMLEGAVGAIPLPGASLLFQRRLLKELKIITDDDVSDIPVGDPNIIKEARARKLIGPNAAGSGLRGKIKISLLTTYEQKFIKGIDPTIVWMDIMANVLSMGTSNANFYLGKTNGNTSLDKFIRDTVADPMGKLKEFIKATLGTFKESLNALKSAISGEAKEKKGSSKRKQKKTAEKAAEKKSAEEAISIDGAIKGVLKYVEEFISAKYRVKAFGVLAALSGGPSTPWHVTVGNPLRPVFCSGDMECTGVDIKLGPVLAFNDLPASITVRVNLISARNQGMQEIFSKFNSGGIRIIGSGDSSKYKSLVEPAISFWSENVFISEDVFKIPKNLDGIDNQSQTPVEKKTKDSPEKDEINKDSASSMPLVAKAAIAVVSVKEFFGKILS